MLYGQIGLNVIPSARMDKTGTIKIGVSTLDPYIHSFAGIQLTDHLHINIRQSAEISNINKDAKHLYPGVDIKLRLLKENHIQPELSIGLQSAIGHKRMAGEYIAISKQHNNFDFTAGLGWGRLGSAEHFNNPLKSILKHFGKNRSLDGEMPNEPANWFTGEKIGIFAGVEYFTPIKGLSIKLDYGADRYKAEKTALNYNAPDPWSAGITYQPTNWSNLSIAMQGTDKLMGRLSLKNSLNKWRDQSAQNKKPIHMRPYRIKASSPVNIKLSAEREGLEIHDIQTNQLKAQAQLTLRPNSSTPEQIGLMLPHIANYSGSEIEEITFLPSIMGLQGTSISLMRRDFEQAITHHQGSPEEIWQHTEFGTFNKKILKRPSRLIKTQHGIIDANIALDNEFSLAEEDSATLYRTSLIAGLRGPKFFGLLDSGYAFRLNIKDNLHNINNIRPTALLPIRSNVDRFAKRTLALDTLYTTFTHSINEDLHIAITGGYLEEMYGGYGGEILYRPFRSRFAIGAESWLAFKRDPSTALNLGFNGDHLLTGHINGWYNIPKHDLTLQARFGRYLAEDIGGTLSLNKQFKNGANLKSFVTITDNADFDLFGGTTHAYHGMQLSLPLGGFKYMPNNTHINIKTSPFGRDTAQSLNTPLPLYELTQGFSYEHMVKYWDNIIF
ncbi:MAG: YjbH domain-containing protein [Alphaproteobacteria bacterium]|nr:YjbH domain-containing protein [Alphaproteobacteria bacterium]